MAMQDYTGIVLEQAFTKSHSVGLAQADRENQAMGNIAEQTRLGFLENKSQMGLAEDILAQRSAQQQPQVGVIPAAGAIATKTS
jgi:hypothetical protein